MPRDPKFQTMSVNLPADLIQRVRTLGFHQDLSASSIVEQAVLKFFEHYSEEELAEKLRELGASLRRA